MLFESSSKVKIGNGKVEGGSLQGSHFGDGRNGSDGAMPGHLEGEKRGNKALA